jgi:hypothetical protein
VLSAAHDRRQKQMHLDPAVDELNEAAAIRLGACGADAASARQVAGLFDPAGHAFCLSIQIPG